MWPSNALTERLNLTYPIILAPMGIITTPALAAAVSNAGGLGEFLLLRLHDVADVHQLVVPGIEADDLVRIVAE